MINTLTLNPAVDRIVFIERLEKNATNRIQNKIDTVGGKGTHVSISLSQLGLKSRAFGFAYGINGKYIVNELNNLGIETYFPFSDKDGRENRTNIIIVESLTSTCTTIAERGYTPTDTEMDTLVSSMKNTISTGDILVLSGDASNCSTPNVYAQIMCELSDKNLKVALDTSGAALDACLKERPFLIKPNKDELSKLCGFQIFNDSDVLRAIESLAIYSIPFIAVSLGAEGAIIKTESGIYKAISPEVEIGNTAGCGDVFLSGLLYGIEKNMSSVDTLKVAIAVSSAAAASPLSIGYDLDFAKKLLSKVEVVPL